MFNHETGRTSRAVAWTASLALASASVVGVALAPNAGAATAHRAGAPGFIEICKKAADSYISGTVQLTITNGTFKDVETVLVGQCTGPIRVPSGLVTVTEKSTTPSYIAKARTAPASALVAQTSNSVTVKVVASTDESRETLVGLWNAAQKGWFKVCKTLTSNGASLIAQGQSTFKFYSSALLPGSYDPFWLRPLYVTVLQTGKMACALYPHKVPLGTIITVKEARQPGAHVAGVSILPASQNAGSSQYVARMKIGPYNDGVTTASFTNTADGTIEICKAIDDSNWSHWKSQHSGQSGDGSPYDGTPFLFSINGGRPIVVRAGSCSAPITVPAGTATVQEIVTPNFHLVGFTAVGPDDSSRLLTSGTSNPIKVSVPAGGVGNETLVTATNAVNVGRVKVCKILWGPKDGFDFAFKTVFKIGEYWYSDYVRLHPTGQGSYGEACSYLSAPVPVVSPDGSPITFTVTEGPSPFVHDQYGNPTVEPVKITYDGNGQVIEVRAWQDGDGNKLDGYYHLTATLGQGVNVVTFTNGFVIDP